MATPVGAFTGFEQEVGVLYVDLQGRPKSSKGKIALTLSWENPVSDYDLVVNGTTAESIDDPETAVAKAAHRTPVDVYLGVPVDELVLSAQGT